MPEDPIGHLAGPSSLWANAFAENLSVRVDNGDSAGLVGQSILTKISNCVIALLSCRKRQAAAFADSSTGPCGRGHAAGVAAAADQGAGPSQAFEGTEVMRAAPDRSPLRRKPATLADHRRIQGAQTPASACRAACSSLPRMLENASKPRFDWHSKPAGRQMI